MSLAASLLPEFDQEFAALRRCLERLPEERLDWSPHERSFSLRGLATHLLTLPHWALLTLEHDELDMDPEGDHNAPIPDLGPALETYDGRVVDLREALAACSDERLLAEWTFRVGGQVQFVMPRVAVLRSFVMNHMIHHRGQLTVYLRLAGVAVPAVYGPSADEGS